MAYTNGGPGMNNVDRKIMWKMYDRERDYKWIYDNNPAATVTDLEKEIDRDTIDITKVDTMTESTEDRKKFD